ncbi:unnamed protein product [Phyllotreta striolata]|uniref:Secreted protein n=1 Tax=Phyllotreta striolata TaxID=444603 RepID=A0A9N9TPL4_PHYSR|nr:unnamed protein product [Phyllotreta striolata]
MGFVQIVVLVSLAIVACQAFPQTQNDEKAPPQARVEESAPIQESADDSTSKDTEPKAPSRAARAAEPQNFVNYIRPDDKFPTVA